MKVRMVEVKVYIPLIVGDDDDVSPDRCIEWVEESLDETRNAVYDHCELGQVIEEEY